MQKHYRWVRDSALTLLILTLCFGVSLLMQDVFEIPEQITTSFAFAVFLISLLTNGYVFGLIAALVSVLSARTDESDKVEAFDLGANDYVTKPFSAAEFLARVRSTLRFSRHSADEGRLFGGKFQVRDLTIEYDSRRVFVGDTEIKLTQTEFNILALLSEYSGKILTYSTIIKTIWGISTEGSIKKLQVNMANIRRKLGITPGENSYIVNELGVGYRMNADD
jgi:two-component system KDP operon response regulator KdpE